MALLIAPSDQYHYRHTARQHSQTPEREDRRRSTKRSPNRVKTKPADPAVISGILESLDTLRSPNVIAPELRTPGPHDADSRPHSGYGSVQSPFSPERARSPGFGVVYGNALSFDDEDGMSDAALPPTVATLRSSSRLSRYAVPRTLSFTSTNESEVQRAPSITSRRSSLLSTSRERPALTRKNLSAASWVEQNSISQESFDTDMSQGGRRSLRRINSRDTLRPTKTRIELVPPATEDIAEEPPNISRAEQIIAKASTPPVASSRRRLYLIDSSSNEEQSGLESPPQTERKPELQDSPATSTSTSLQGQKSPARLSPQKNAILDSVPVRTSSLRQTNSPSSGRKKERKPKRKSDRSESSRKAEGKVDSVVGPDSKSIPESSWADLGEDDETVKRIRELRERRKSRQLEERSNSVPEVFVIAKPEPTESDSSPSSIEPVSARLSDEVKRASRARPATNRALTEPPSKALKVLGITADPFPVRPLNGQPVIDLVAHSITSDSNRRPQVAVSESKPLTRPTTVPSSNAPTPPISLDYSYAEAVSALQGIEREIKEDKQRDQETPTRPSLQSTRPSVQSTVQSTKSVRPSAALQYFDLPLAGTPLPVYEPPLRQRSNNNKRRPSQDRWTLHHPDLPLDFDKRKNRRKSTSDARSTRHFDADVDPPLPRRDSIAVAIGEYLQDARLNRRIKHPLTGRVISFSEVGDPEGSAVFICVGMGLTRYVTAFYDELAMTLRLRLITVDRPGVGGSEPYPPTDRSGPLSWPDDVLAICQHLGIAKFSLLAHSAGAIYALATALILPHLIQGKVHLLAPWIPPSQLEAISHPAASAPPAGALPRSQRFLRVLPTPLLKAANSSFMTATSTSLKPAKRSGKAESPRRGEPARPTSSRGDTRPPSRNAHRPDIGHRRESLMLMDQYMPDVNQMENFPMTAKEDNGESLLSRTPSFKMGATATPMDPSFEFAASALNAAEHTEKERKTEYTSQLTQRIWELATRDSNPATDLLVCLERHRDVGFRYTDVNRQVVITHGSEDKRVPVANVKWLAEQMNRRALRETSSIDLSANGGCEVRVLEGDGHGLMASPIIMGDLLTEISRYWANPSNGWIGM